MRVLLDTCVLSELRYPKPCEKVRHAIDQVDNENLFVSVITIGEIIKGISLLDDGKRKSSLQQWLQTLERNYTENILPIDLQTSHIWGEITALAQKKGKTIPISDALIAATAIRNGLYVMTRNVNDFCDTGAMVVNPWSA